MKLRPMKIYARPNFPTQQFFNSHPEMLRIIPKRWQKNAVITLALSTTFSLSALRPVAGAVLSSWMGGDN